ncbi:multidrug resistance-associated 1 isoform X1 [Micractinium conductrix]|uniref:Multidrug resistance-associated 1 isoform X1 n=1 Tax=Micractinium conductrix TaxID=554055 RepID=A0A2P6VQ79_9CHLO|nr:multidrug resistance-associated 1 isoform X1 [Micractinium conductrix]|eukprot:PSC76242.1 multidrug resistance-associated 1 isoform X1 [Micractinium conductrix]
MSGVGQGRPGSGGGGAASGGAAATATRGMQPSELDELEGFDDITLLLEAEQRQQQRSWWGRMRGRLPAWLRPGGQQEAYRFHRLTAEEGAHHEAGPSDEAEGDSAGVARDGATAALRPPGRWCPEETAGFLSRLSFNYVGGLIQLGYRKTLQPEDLWDVAASDGAAAVADTFQFNLSSAQAVIWRAMWRTHGRAFIYAGVVKLLHDCVMFLGPFILELLLKHLQTDGSAWVGLGLASALAAFSVVETLTVNVYFHRLFRICLHLKVALVDALYRKSLRISAAARAEHGAGKIVNLQSNDAAKLWSIPQYLHIIWSGPFQILVVMGLLVRVIHLLPALAGLGATLALIPLSAVVGKLMASVRREMVGHTDARVKLATEVITGIKAIKLYAWEQPYVDRITQLREKELRQIRKATLLGCVNNLVWGGGPIIISLAALLTYSAMGYPLTASVAFPALSLFNLLRFPVIMFPQQIMNLINGKVALDRIQKFIEAEEMAARPVLPPAAPGQAAVEVINGSFAWARGADPLLRGVSVAVPRGSLVIVVGSVGCGKSSLLSAMLGEMVALQGSANLRGSTAYTQQDPWIQNATLKDNILMGAPLEEGRYQDVLEACALRPDLELLPAGDDTEIGEKGVNLSGGQRHRVALARACYAYADVYLLDDPLSAVDAHVGRHLFDRCLCGLLGKATRVLVTHQLQYLPAADRILVLREGTLAESGTYHELVARGVDFHQFAVSAPSSAASEAGDEEAAAGGTCLGGTAAGQDDSAGEAEGQRRGGGSELAALSAAQRGVLLSDSAIELQTRGKGSAAAAATAADGAAADAAAAAAVASSGICVAAQTGGAVTVFTDVPLHDGAAGGAGQSSSMGAELKFTPKPAPVMSPTRANLLAPLAAPAGGAAGVGPGGDGKLTKAEERAVGQVDKAVYLTYFSSWSPAFIIPLVVLTLSMVERGLQAGQNWWLSVWSEATAAAEADADPAGLHSRTYMLLYFGLGLSSLVFQIVKAVMLVFGSVNAARVLQERLLACVVRLPMSFFDSQPTGRLLNRFTKDTESVDMELQSSVSSFLNCAVSVVWSLVVVVAVSPGILAAILPLSVSYYFIQTRYIRSSREIKRLDSLALSPIFGHFGETLQGLVTVRAFRQQAAFEQRNSLLLDGSNRAWWPAQCINRWLSMRLELLGISVVFGTAVLVGVAAPRSAGLAGLALTSALNLTGLMNWMVRQTTELEVNMNSVERMVEYTSYEPEAPSVIEGRRPLPGWPHAGGIEVERLVVRYRPELDPVLKGISFSVRGREKVGVAGRTGCGKSTLFLALYRIIEPSQGRIVIDGLDITTIGLYDLRSRLALVPQDPVVFSGTVRSNLDPFGDAGSDDRIWGALTQAGLADHVRSLQGGLDGQIAEGGGNLSTGQRQLLCMARALLRAARILILDEATSNVDTASDALIQRTIAAAFADCTVLTIAHRLHTIMDSDRILVLDAGSVREYDTPAALLAQPGSAFRGMVEETARHAEHTSSGAIERTPSAKALVAAVQGKLGAGLPG